MRGGLGTFRWRDGVVSIGQSEERQGLHCVIAYCFEIYGVGMTKALLMVMLMFFSMSRRAHASEKKNIFKQEMIFLQIGSQNFLNY